MILQHFRSMSKLCLCILLVTVILSPVSCNSYDEQDATIIGFLKINDLLEKQLSPKCEAEIEQFEQTVQDHYGLLGILSAYTNYIDDPYLNYDEDCINYFFNTIYDDTSDTYDMATLENEITSELWIYIDNLYADIIPAKAQNIEKGRYYTITELKEMYPEYAQLEMQDFSPMSVINVVKDEYLFGPTSFFESHVNLRTLYMYYLYNRKLLEKADKMSSLVEYSMVVDSHFPDGIPDNLDVESIVNIFKKLSTGENPIYSDDMEGFKKFAFDYFETDMFSGEDTQY